MYRWNLSKINIYKTNIDKNCFFNKSQFFVIKINKSQFVVIKIIFIFIFCMEKTYILQVPICIITYVWEISKYQLLNKYHVPCTKYLTSIKYLTGVKHQVPSTR